MSCMQEKGAAKICPHCGWNENTPPVSPLHLPPATVLLDRYIAGRVLGQGSCGITYMGYDIVRKDILAIKEYLPAGLGARIAGAQEVVPSPEPDARPIFREGFRRFIEEGEALIAFNNDAGMVSVRACLEANATAYLIMTYLKGPTLSEYLSNPPRTLSFDEIMKMMIPVLGALSRIHRTGLLHRDIAPDNIIITEDGKAWLIDFATARNAVAEKRHTPDKVLKSGYAACEQHYSLAAQGSWTDVYGIAATIYRAIAGQPPPESLARIHKDSIVVPSRLGIDIPDFAEAALLKALAVRANERYQRISEFANDLRRSRNEPEETGDSIGTAPESAANGSDYSEPLIDAVCPEETVRPSEVDKSDPALIAPLPRYQSDPAIQPVSLPKYQAEPAINPVSLPKYQAEPAINPVSLPKYNSDPATREVPAECQESSTRSVPETRSSFSLAPESSAPGEPVPESSSGSNRPPRKRTGWDWLFNRRTLMILLFMIVMGIIVGLAFSLYKGYLAPDTDAGSQANPLPAAAAAVIVCASHPPTITNCSIPANLD